jgi:hypothetical protein
MSLNSDTEKAAADSASDLQLPPGFAVASSSAALPFAESSSLPDDVLLSPNSSLFLCDFVPLYKAMTADSNQRIVTIFFMGTKEDLSKAEQDDEYPHGCLVSSLAKEARACQQEVLAYHGPGVEPDSEYLFTPRGERNYDVDTATGWSMDDNVNDAVEALKDRYLRQLGNRTSALQEHCDKQRKIVNNELGPVTQVNVVGWSRGGATAIKFANACLADADLASVRINIFAVDPVPGPGNFSVDTTTLGSNVASYEAYYAAHERSACFHPVIPTRAEGNRSTKIIYYTMPGYHASLVGNVMTRDKSRRFNGVVDHAARLIRDAAQKFLVTQGTVLPEGNLESLSAMDMVECYAAVKRNLLSYSDVAAGQYIPYLSYIDWLVGLRRENPTQATPVLHINQQSDLVYAHVVAEKIAQRFLVLFDNPDAELDAFQLDKDFVNLLEKHRASLDDFSEDDWLTLTKPTHIRVLLQVFESLSYQPRLANSNVALMWRAFRARYDACVNHHVQLRFDALTQQNTALASERDVLLAAVDTLTTQQEAAQYTIADLEADHEQLNAELSELHVQVDTERDALAHHAALNHRFFTVLSREPISRILQQEYPAFEHEDHQQIYLNFVLNDPYVQRLKADVFSALDAEYQRLSEDQEDDANFVKRICLLETKAQLCRYICDAFMLNPERPDIRQIHQRIVTHLMGLATESTPLSAESKPLRALFRTLLGIVIGIGLSGGLLFFSERFRASWFSNHTQYKLRVATREFEKLTEQVEPRAVMVNA